MKDNLKENLIRFFTFISGLYFLLYFLLPAEFLDNFSVTAIHPQISKSLIIISAMAFGVGIIQVFKVHFRKIVTLEKNWFYSTTLLTSMLLTLFVGLYEFNFQIKGVETKVSSSVLKVIEDGFFVPLGSSMFSLLAFYIASAAFRSFRIKNFQSGLLLLGAFIVILGQSPLGTYLSASLPSVRNWLLLVPSSAAFRGIAIGSSIAALVLAIKIWLSISIITKK